MLMFKKVDKLPERSGKSSTKVIDRLLNGFVTSEAQLAEVVGAESHYSTLSVAATTLNQSAKLRALPLKFIVLDGKVYVMRTDM